MTATNKFFFPPYTEITQIILLDSLVVNIVINVETISFQTQKLLPLFHENIRADTNYLRNVQLRGLLQYYLQK